VALDGAITRAALVLTTLSRPDDIRARPRASTGRRAPRDPCPMLAEILRRARTARVPIVPGLAARA